VHRILKLRSIFESPEFVEDEKTRQARILINILLASLVLEILLGIFTPFISNGGWIQFFILLGMAIAQVFLLFLTWRGKVKLASLLLVTGLASGVLFASYFSGGVQAISFSVYIMVILGGGLLLGRKAVNVLALTGVVAGLGFLWAESAGLLPAYQAPDPLMVWAVTATLFAWTALVLVSSIGNTLQALEQARKEVLQRKAAEERFKSVFDNATIGLYRTTPDGQIIMANQALCRMLGYQSFSEMTLHSLTGLEVGPDTPRRAFREQIEREGQVNQLETIWQRAGGRQIYVCESARAVRDAHGKTIYYEGTVEDTTEQKLAEMALQRRLKELSVLHAVAQVSTEALSTDDIIARSTLLIRETLFPDHFGLLLLDEKENALRPHPSYQGLSAGILPALAPLDGSLCGQAYCSGLAVRLGDESPDSEYPYTTPGMRSGLCVPLRVGDQMIGVINAESSRANSFSEEDERLLLTLASQLATAIQRARLHEQTERRLRQLQALHTIDLAITSNMDLKRVLETLLEQVVTRLHVDAASVLVLVPSTQTLETVARSGFRTSALLHGHVRVGEGYAGRAAQEQKIVQVPDLNQGSEELQRSEHLGKEGFLAYVAAPLIAKERVKGVLEVFHRCPLDADEEWMEYLNALAVQAAIAVELSEVFQDLQRMNEELIHAYDTTLEGWSYALELRDQETEGHTRRVTEVTCRLARTMGLDETELLHVRRGALLHDIGKMGIPDSILRKPGPLTKEEWQIMRRHPVYAYKLLAGIPFLQQALDIPYYHHEKWDGTGYPFGLKGEEIPLAARIFAVVDVWDALSSDRPYQKGWPRDKIRQHIAEQSGLHFDPKVVDKFLYLVDNE